MAVGQCDTLKIPTLWTALDRTKLAPVVHVSVDASNQDPSVTTAQKLSCLKSDATFDSGMSNPCLHPKTPLRAHTALWHFSLGLALMADVTNI